MRGSEPAATSPAAVLLAVGVAMARAGLAVGEWAAYLAAPAVLAALVLKFCPGAKQ